MTRTRGDTYTVATTGYEGDHHIVVMAAECCGHLLPIALGYPGTPRCIIPGHHGRYLP